MECKNISSKIILLSIIVAVLCIVQPTLGIDIPEKNRSKIKVNKCCSLNEHVGNGKACQLSEETHSFFDMPVYINENLKKSRKPFKELFELAPNRFIMTNFRIGAFRPFLFGYKGYLRVDGTLLVDAPNRHNRWIKIRPANYCVDFFHKTNATELTPDFWVLFPAKTKSETNKLLTIATLISCFFMLLFLIVYFFLPELRDEKGYIQMAYVASQLMAFLLLSMIQISGLSVAECVGLTLGTYFFFLATFCWINVLSFDIWWHFRNLAKNRQSRRRKSFKFTFYCLYALGLPLLMTFALGMLNWYRESMKRYPRIVIPHIPEDGCFLRDSVKMLYLYTPMMIIIIINWTFYMITVFNIWRWKRGTQVFNGVNELSHRTDFRSFIIYIKLSVVMGLNWFLEIISFKYPNNKWYYITDVFNILTGLTIFIIFICKKDVWIKLRKRCNELRTRYKRGGSSNSQVVRLSRQQSADSACEAVNLKP
ncbi:unnamed protein product [Spodoptera littoralis]|uniref:G-protein coupled receptors family 2 profile 2 domain-containing protein n=1 Tax=Spodoptera littoralis TaxID=7109 RepID=A0A9P0I2P3_SPOLI|nr:unnamed protein product [Spodoptera littoralis]CAH1638356.1 unnamed protein product [Spodoptera littoralis]